MDKWQIFAWVIVGFGIYRILTALDRVQQTLNAILQRLPDPPSAVPPEVRERLREKGLL